MTPLMERLSSDFLPLFLRGMVVNFEIAVIALAVGLALGLLLAFARLGGGVPGGAAASVISVMRAAPTFVVMFFLLNAIPRDASSAAAAIGVTEGITVILRHAEQLPALGDRLVLFATGIVLFGIPLQAGFAIMSVIQRRLSLKVARPPADAA